MILTYVNRHGQTCRFYSRKTKTGKETYTASKSRGPEGALTELPEGYEIYENYNAQVFLRKTAEQVITDFEVAQVRKIVQDKTNLLAFWVERKKDAIVVSTSDNHDPVSGFGNSNDFFGTYLRSQMNDFLSKRASLMPMMRFVLVDKEERCFAVERYCFRGSIDDWIPVGFDGPKPLIELANTYCPHLGKDSFYELM